MKAHTVGNTSNFYQRKVDQRDREKTRLFAHREIGGVQPDWEILYTPNDARRDLIAFSIALAITLMTLALTNFGVLG